jgi:3-methyladenine DNA glycosylase/8-oxoguanine DNA glycosylase
MLLRGGKRTAPVATHSSLSPAREAKRRHGNSGDKASSVNDDFPAALSAVIKEAVGVRTRSGWCVGDGMRHLAEVEPKLRPYLARDGIPSPYSDAAEQTEEDAMQASPFHHLVRVIVFQQLQGKAAQTIFERVLQALRVADGAEVTPEMIRRASIQSAEVDGKTKILINGCVSGLSGAKASYITSLAEHFTDPESLQPFQTHADLAKLGDGDLQKRLTAVKGLGVWSVHMYQIFKLHRPDVLAEGDLGVRKGLCKLHGLPPKTFEGGKQGLDKFRQYTSKWAPYSSLGCLFMYRVADTESSL